MQGEIYTVDDIGGSGHQKMSLQKLMDERPEYFVFNGAVGALTTQHPNHAYTQLLIASSPQNIACSWFTVAAAAAA